MRPEPQLLLDPRRARELRDLLLSRRAAYLPGWEPPEGEAEDALLWVAARYLEAILQRLNQAPEKNRLAFLDLLGVRLTPAQAARAPIVFQVAEDAPPLTRAPAGTQLSAEPPPESTTRVVFETETGVGFTRGRLQQVVSLWAGRDQYADHSAALAAGEPFQSFFKRELQDTPHHIYIAHNPLLAIAGEAEVSLTFELTQTSSEHLRIAWEYWDGEVWRGFKSAGAGCEDAGGALLDSTQGLTQSGRFLLQSDCAEAKTTTVNGVENCWIRGRLLEPRPPDPAQRLGVLGRRGVARLQVGGCGLRGRWRRGARQHAGPYPERSLPAAERLRRSQDNDRQWRRELLDTRASAGAAAARPGADPAARREHRAQHRDRPPAAGGA